MVGLAGAPPITCFLRSFHPVRVRGEKKGMSGCRDVLCQSKRGRGFVFALDISAFGDSSMWDHRRGLGCGFCFCLVKKKIAVIVIIVTSIIFTNQKSQWSFLQAEAWRRFKLKKASFNPCCSFAYFAIEKSVCCG